MEKYYTPEIEEFHVGFEYEIYEDWDTDDKKSWHKQVYSNITSNAERLEYVGGDMKKFRVKYLDKEDIESLGFKYFKTHPGTTTLEFEGDKCDITFDSEFSKYWNITITHTEDGDFTYFHGFIKNKSELKKLLKQLNIEHNDKN
jgi:hypothetical protein